jgi:hypothetical protein
MSTSLSVAKALNHCDARARCSAPRWGENAEPAVQPRDEAKPVCGKRCEGESCTSAERTNRVSLEYIHEPDAGAADGVRASNMQGPNARQSLF